MSYGRGDLDGGSNSQPPSYDSCMNSEASTLADYTRLTTLVQSNIQNIIRSVHDIKQKIGLLQKSKDTQRQLQQLQQEQRHANQLAKDTSRYLRNVKNMPSASSASEQLHRNTQFNRLMSDFRGALNTLQTTQHEATIAENECVARLRAASTFQHDQNTDVSVSQQGTMQQQQQATLTADELAEIKETENVVKQLERDLIDVNIVFRELAAMVEDQGHTVDSIAGNVENAEVNVRQGVDNLNGANQNQASLRKKKCIIVVIVVVVLIIGGVIIGTSV